MLAVLLMSWIFSGALSQFPSSLPGSASLKSDSTGSHNNVQDLLPPNMLPKNSLSSPVILGLPLSAAVQDITPGSFVPNFDQRNINGISRNSNDPRLFPEFGNAFNLQNQFGQLRNAINTQNRFGISAQQDQPEWQEEINRWNRHTISPLSIERNLPPWLTNTFSDRFNNPFTPGLPNIRNGPIMDIPFQKAASTAPEHIEIPSDKDLVLLHNIKNLSKIDIHPAENKDFASKINIPQIIRQIKRGPLVGPLLPNIDVMQHIDDLSMTLDDVFMKQVPKITCSLRLYPLYKRVMVNMVKEFFLKAKPNERLFSMLWRDLRICGHIKSSKTDKLVKKLQRYDREKSKYDSYEKLGSVIPKNVLKKRKYLEKTLSKRYKEFELSKKPLLRSKSRGGSSSFESSQSEKSISSEEFEPRGERYPKALHRDRPGLQGFPRFKNRNRSEYYGQDSSDESD